MPALDQDLRPEVGVAAARCCGAALTTAATPAGDQRLGAHPVEVEVVDDRDVARAAAAW